MSEESPLVMTTEKDNGNEPLVAKETMTTSKMNAVSLLAVVYFLVCGGAYGTEDIGGGIPPVYALGGLLLIPWIWSLPTALATAELASAFPHSGGFIHWIKLAFGDFAAFMDGWIMLWVVIIDQALYPIIFVDYFANIVHLSYWEEWGVCLLYIAVAMLTNLFGGWLVGKVSEVFVAVALIPFAIYVVCGFISPHFEPSNWLDDSGDWDLDIYLSVLVWATCGYEYSGFLVHDVKDSKKTFPIVMCVAVCLMLLTYLMPVSIAIATYPLELREQIEEGSYPALGNHLGFGEWLGYLLVIGGLGSTMGTYSAYLRTSSTALHELASDGKAPTFFTFLFDRFNVPVVPIVFYSVFTAVLVLFDFTELVEVEAMMYCVHQLILFSAFLRNRFKYADVERPFQIPGSYVMAIIVSFLPMSVAAATIGSMTGAEWPHILAGTIVLLIGALLYFAHHWYKVWKRSR